MSDVVAEARRRRTFAVISHPDAGKSTLTEALALYAERIDSAGAVHGKSGRRGVTSDWMEMERKRGISVPSLPCPSLVIAGADFPDERGRCLADLYGSEFVEFPELQHFDLVLDAAPRRAVADFLRIRGTP